MVTQDSNGRLLALATVDTFGGNAAAAELKRAVDDLGCVGLFAESAHGDRIIADLHHHVCHLCFAIRADEDDKAGCTSTDAPTSLCGHCGY